MSSHIKTEDLDFADIKQNLKIFLSAQPALLDYDFDGSVISNLLDVLAYNTHYNALYTNLAINEMFLDSASKRTSIASIAKLLGYTPKSISCARANISIVASRITGTPAATLNIPKGTTFATSLNGKNYVFNLSEDIVAAKDTTQNQYVFTAVNIYEGEQSTVTYTYNGRSKLIVPEIAADISTLKVSVSSQNVTTVYVAATSIVDVVATDNVFYTKYRDDGFYEIYFGAGTFGTEVPNGAIVSMSYIVCSGPDANLASSFAYSGGADAAYSYTATTLYASAGGAKEEDKESIRFFAPMTHQAQGRAVTANDYVAIIANAYPNIETIAVWGGQDNIPPKYGKVFIAAKPYGRDTFTTLEKYDLALGIVKSRGVVTVVPEFVDPKYLKVELTCNVYYNPSTTTLTAGAIQSNVIDVVGAYSNTLSKFDVAYRHSVITGNIATAAASIVSTINTVRVRQSVAAILGVSTNYSAHFGNPIAASTLSTFSSTRFFMAGYAQRGYLANDGSDIVFYTEDAAGTPTYRLVIGTLDFRGSVTLQNLQIQSLYDDMFEFVFYPSSYDIVPPNGTIVTLPMQYVNVNMIVDTLSQSRNTKGEYVFSPSR